MVADVVEHIRGALVQHGPLNDRIYVMRAGRARDAADLVPALDALARQKRYGKILAKIPAPAWPAFKGAGYEKEAAISGFFRDGADALFVAKYIRNERRRESSLEAAVNPFGESGRQPAAADLSAAEVAPCTPADAETMGAIYRRVFHAYPFPIDNPGYLKERMAADVSYFGIHFQGRLAALAAAEMDPRHGAVELTDFATLPRWRRCGLAGRLRVHMEAAVSDRGLRTAFAIARAASPGMNRVFAAGGYRYGGRLRNNTRIGKTLESMNVWFKSVNR